MATVGSYSVFEGVASHGTTLPMVRPSAGGESSAGFAAPQTIVVLVQAATEDDRAELGVRQAVVDDTEAGGPWAQPLGDVLAYARRRFSNLGEITAIALSPTNLPREVAAERTLVFDDLTIDAQRREVRVDGALRHLTKSEFDLLHVLAERPGIVLTRRQLVDAYKGSDYPADDRSIDVQMYNLRRKLGAAGQRLQTARGVGYRFCDQNL